MPFVSDVENIQQLRLPYLLSLLWRRSNFPTQRQRHPAAQPPFYFFYARFSNQGNPSSPLFQIQQCKDKDTQQLNLFCSLSPRISEFSNTMQSLSSPRWFCIFHRDKIIYCLVFSFSPPSFLLSPILHFSHPPTCWQCLPVVWLVSRIYKNLDPSENPNARLADSTKILPRGGYDQISTTKVRYLDVIQMHWGVLIKLARRSWSQQWRSWS